MAKDDIELDDIDLDGFDDFDSMDDPFEMKDDRSPTTKVKDGVLNKVKDPSTAAEVASIISANALPEGFQAATDLGGRALDEARGIYNDAAKELEGPIKGFKKTINRHIDKASFLPDSVRKRIKDKTKVESDFGAPTKESINEANIAATVEGIFAAQAALETEKTEAQSEMDMAKGKVEQARFNAETKITGSMAESMDRLTNYTFKVQSNYQRKMLELSQRKYFLLKDMLESNTAANVDIVSNLRGILKNTGLPDFLKERMSETYKEEVRDRMVGKLADTASTHSAKLFSKIAENAKGKVSDAVVKAREGITFASDTIDQFGDMADPDAISPDKVELGASMAAGFGLNKLGQVAGRRIGEMLQKNPKMMAYSDKLMYLTENYPSMVDEWANSSSDNMLMQQLKDIVPRFEGTDVETLSGNITENGGETARFTNMAHKSITDIIPGYLSRQLQVLTDLRDGGRSERLVYSADRDTLVSESSEINNIKSKVFGDDVVNRARDNSGRLIDLLDPGKTLTDRQRAELRQRLVNDANDGKTFSVQNYSKSDGTATGDILKDLTSGYVGGDGKTNHAGDAVNLKASRIFRDLGQGMGDLQSVIRLAELSGNTGLLDAAGLTRMNGGKREIDFGARKDMFNRRLNGESITSPAEAVEAARNGPGINPANASQYNMSEVNEMISTLPEMVRQKFFEEIEGRFGVPVHVISGLNTSPNGPMDGGDGGGGGKPLDPMMQAYLDGITERLDRLIDSSLAMNFSSDSAPKASGQTSTFWRNARGNMKSALGTGKSLLGGYYSTLGNAAAAGVGIARDLGGKAIAKIKAGSNPAKERFNQLKDMTLDLYLKGKETPVLLASRMKAGEYRDKITGKVITKLSDIKGEVVDESGNIILTYQDYIDGLYDSSGKLLDFSEAKSSAVTFLKGAASKLGSFYGAQLGLLGTGLAIAKTGMKKAYSYLDRPMDIYVAGDNRPRLLASILEKGGYISARTGKPIKTVKDIDGDVIDASTGNVILSTEDMRSGLFDRFGNTFDSGAALQRVKGLVTNVKGRIGDAATAAANRVSAITGKAKDRLASIRAKKQGIGAAGVKAGNAMAHADNVMLLQRIVNHMEARWPIENYSVSSNDVAFKQQRVVNAMDNFAGDFHDVASDRMSGRNMDQLPEVRMTKSIDELVSAVKESSIKDRDGVDMDLDLKDKKEMSKSSIKDIMAGILMKLSPEKVDGDMDGDGKRDGGLYSRLQKMRDKRKAKKTDPRKAANDAKSGKRDDDDDNKGLFGMLSGLFGGLGDKIGGMTKLITGSFTKLTSVLALLKGGSSLADGIDMDGPDGDRRGKGKKPKGKGGFLKKAARLGGKALRFGAGSIGTIAKVGLHAGRALLMANPIGLAVTAAAGLAYGGYKAYKYFKGRAEAKGLDRVRFLEYGVDVNDKSQLGNIRELESNVEETLDWSNGRPEMTKPVSHFVEEYAEDFGVNMEDPGAMQQWGIWFAKRFVPVFLTHLSTARSLGYDGDADGIDAGLTGDARKAFVERTSLEGISRTNGPMSVSVSPWSPGKLPDNLPLIKKELDKYEIDTSKPVNKEKDKREDSPKTDKKSAAEKAADVAATKVAGMSKSEQMLQESLDKTTKALDKINTDRAIDPVMTANETSNQVTSRYQTETMRMQRTAELQRGTLVNETRRTNAILTEMLQAIKGGASTQDVVKAIAETKKQAPKAEPASPEPKASPEVIEPVVNLKK